MKKLIRVVVMVFLIIIGGLGVSTTQASQKTGDLEASVISFANDVTITFNVNGGNGTHTTMTRTSGQAIGTLPTPTRSGHTFLGWFPTATGTLIPSQQITSVTTVPNDNVTYFARWAQSRSRTLTHTGSMMIQGFAGLTTNSTPITFNGNAIPANATVESISINTGTSTMSGVITGNNLQVRSTAVPGTLTIPWNGANNSVLNNTHFFWNHTARATYTVLWNGTVIGNTPGTIWNPGGTAAIRGFSNVRLTINYLVPL